MRPDFALSLSFDGIVLLQRAPLGWVPLGDVALDDPHMDASLAALRAKATALQDGAARVKLIIPNEQIRYIGQEAHSESPAAALEQARQAVDGATPYAVDELKIDVAQLRDRLLIAAVAKETLDEAEAFAAGHGFEPVAFVAVPPAGAFEGEVFFGPGEAWRRASRPAPERDDDAVRVVPYEAGWPEAAESADPVELPGTDMPDQGMAADAETGDDAAVAEQTEPDMAADSAAETVDEIPAVPLAASEESPQRADTTSADAPPQAPATVPGDGGDAKGDAADSDAPGLSFVSIRAVRATAPEGRPDVLGSARKLSASRDATGPGPRFSLSAVAARLPQGSAPPVLTGVTDGALPPDPEDSKAPAPAPSEAAPESPVIARPKAGKPKGPSLTLGKAAAKFGALKAPVAAPGPKMVSARSEAADIDVSAPVPPNAATAPAAAGAAVAVADPDEARRLTTFGARDAAVGGKPRHLGLILTAILLLFLAGVAAWASVFLDDGVAGLFQRDKPAIETAGTDTALPRDLIPEASDEALADGEAVIELAALDTGPETSEPPAISVPMPPPAHELSRDEAERLHAETGIWQRAPDAPAPIAPGDASDVYEASIDPTVTVEDAVALPSGESLSEDRPYDAPTNPLAAEIEYELDARGLVVARLEGALNPEGVIVYAGLPPVVAPNRPDFASLGIRTPEDAAENARLSRLRPKARPDTGVLRESNERARLSGYSMAELEGIRPQARPVTEKETTEQSAPEATAQAVAASLAPVARPRDMSRIVARAEREAPQREAVEVASAAAVAPRQVAPKTVTPSAPSPTTVARQATIENAINLRKINLIGVFGTQSQRRALVRLSNGKYQKVKVGDRIDGGRVSAISDSELRYQKGGRSVVLKMPRG